RGIALHALHVVHGVHLVHRSRTGVWRQRSAQGIRSGPRAEGAWRRVATSKAEPRLRTPKSVHLLVEQGEELGLGDAFLRHRIAFAESERAVLLHGFEVDGDAPRR